VLTYSEVLAQWDEIRSHPNHDPTFNYLTDLTKVTDYKISTMELKKLGKIEDPFSLSSLRVVVAPTDLLFGMVRMYEFSGELRHPKVYTVRTIEEALRILSGSS